jgi:ATP-dependent RNA helicase DDX47/RRP3
MISLNDRYDVELFQRIETLIGKKLPAFPTQEEEVMMLVERVSEAQRFARLVSRDAIAFTSHVRAFNQSY